MQRDDRQPRDAATFGDAQHPDPDTGTGATDASDSADTPDRMEHAEIRKNVPGERNDLNADNTQRLSGSPAEAARRTPREDASAPRRRHVPHQRETAEMSPDDFDSDDTID